MEVNVSKVVGVYDNGRGKKVDITATRFSNTSVSVD